MRYFEYMLKRTEGRNRGWIKAGKVPQCKVLLDGKEVACSAVHRKKKKAIVPVTDSKQNLIICKHGKNIRHRMVYFNKIELLPMN